MRLVEIAVFTADLEATVDFYARLLGVDPERDPGDSASFDLGGVKLFIHHRYQPGPGQLPAEDHVAFGVRDLDAAHRNLRQKGLSFDVPPRAYHWGRSAYLRDPDGRVVELHQIL